MQAHERNRRGIVCKGRKLKNLLYFLPSTLNGLLLSKAWRRGVNKHLTPITIEINYSKAFEK